MARLAEIARVLQENFEELEAKLDEDGKGFKVRLKDDDAKTG